MARHHTALALVGWSLVAVSFAGCDGDDVNPALPDAGAADATTSHDSGSGEGLCAVVDAAAYSASDIAAGESLVVAHGCQHCHGQSLSGNNDGMTSPGFG